MKQRLGLAGTCLAVVVLALNVTIAPALAAREVYLDFDSTGSPGEVPQKAIKSSDVKSTEIEVSSFSFGGGRDEVIPNGTALNIGSASGGAGAGKRTAQSMDVTVSVTGAQRLFDLASKGQVVREVRLLEFRTSPAGALVPVYTAVMSNVVITSHDWSGKGTDKPTVSITLDFERIEVQENAKSTSDDPSTPASWNLTQNMPT
jgi:type VI protein secretion system component Hcp